MTTPAKKKQELREHMRSLRRRLNPAWMERASSLIVEKVLALPQFDAARVVSCYVSLPHEARTERLIEMCWRLGKRVCVPAWEKTRRDYEMAWLSPGEETGPGPFRIPQPLIIRPCPIQEVNLLIAPAMAYDRHGRRLGHGLGHYDRLMAQCSGYKIGLIFESQLVDEAPVIETDVSVDIVVTERNLYPPASVCGGRG
jgi:5-formyltetrahydrofolate cyclo-ligase